MEKILVSACLIGEKAPRPAAEIVGGGGASVLADLAIVRTASGADVTRAFREGAGIALETARRQVSAWRS